MGAEASKKVLNSNEKNLKAYHTLIGLMLSSQTKDEVTHSTVRFLINEKNLSIETIMKTEEKELNEWISKVGFHNKKATYIKKTTEMIVKDHKGIVPNSLEEICKFPGVGQKMAHLLLQIEFGKVVGISVDTHVHRISNRLKWVRNPTKDPNATSAALMDWLPEDKWVQVNKLLVGFGQVMCKPVGPRCWECPIVKLCPMKGKNLKPSEESKKRPNVSDAV